MACIALTTTVKETLSPCKGIWFRSFSARRMKPSDKHDQTLKLDRDAITNYSFKGLPADDREGDGGRDGEGKAE